MTPIRTRRLILRNWEERDRDLFFRINSDRRVMEFFGFQRDRAQSDALFDLLRADIDEFGYGFAAAELADSGECIGFAGIQEVDFGPMQRAGITEIGWRLAPEFWGKGLATEAATAWLAHGFEVLGLPEIVSFAVWSNARSIAVMERIGMHRDASRDFDHPKVPDSRPDLKRHVFYSAQRPA